MTEQTLGDQPIERQYREMMNSLAHYIDRFFNGPNPKPRKTGFVLMTFEFGEHNRCNYISNANRDDIVVLLREQLRRFEGSPRFRRTLGSLDIRDEFSVGGRERKEVLTRTRREREHWANARLISCRDRRQTGAAQHRVQIGRRPSAPRGKRDVEEPSIGRLGPRLTREAAIRLSLLPKRTSVSAALFCQRPDCRFER
jgi:hypothetical protein